MTASLSVSESPPVAGPPPDADGAEVAAYTRRLVAAAFLTENTARQADRDPTALTLSGVGGCTRRAAYSIAGTDASDVPPPEEARAAVLGTWLHDNLLPRMASAAGPGAVVEQPVKLHAAGLVLDGTLDMAQVARWGAPLDTVFEAKSVGEFRMQGVRRLDGAYTAHWLQGMSYGLAWLQGGHDLDWMTFLYMNRATGAVHVETDRFTNRAMLAVIDRIREITYWAERPDQAPRAVATVGGRHREYALMRGPGLSLACDSCPFLRRCWGPTAVPGVQGAQRHLAATPEGVEQALALYATGAELESEGRKHKEFAKLVVADVPDGPYGKWTLRRGKDGKQLDQATARQRLEELGEEIPMADKAGAISVRPTPQEV